MMLNLAKNFAVYCVVKLNDSWKVMMKRVLSRNYNFIEI